MIFIMTMIRIVHPFYLSYLVLTCQYLQVCKRKSGTVGIHIKSKVDQVLKFVTINIGLYCICCGGNNDNLFTSIFYSFYFSVIRFDTREFAYKMSRELCALPLLEIMNEWRVKDCALSEWVSEQRIFYCPDVSAWAFVFECS